MIERRLDSIELVITACSHIDLDSLDTDLKKTVPGLVYLYELDQKENPKPDELAALCLHIAPKSAHPEGVNRSELLAIIKYIVENFKCVCLKGEGYYQRKGGYPDEDEIWYMPMESYWWWPNTQSLEFRYIDDRVLDTIMTEFSDTEDRSLVGDTVFHLLLKGAHIITDEIQLETNVEVEENE